MNDRPRLRAGRSWGLEATPAHPAPAHRPEVDWAVTDEQGLWLVQVRLGKRLASMGYCGSQSLAESLAGALAAQLSGNRLRPGEDADAALNPGSPGNARPAPLGSLRRDRRLASHPSPRG